MGDGARIGLGLLDKPGTGHLRLRLGQFPVLQGPFSLKGKFHD